MVPFARTSLGKFARASIGPERTARFGDRYDDTTRLLNYMSSSWGRKSARKLRELRNAYAGERAFVIGNGPSLRGMDLTPLANEHTFGSNRIYLAFEEWGFATTFLCATSELVISQFGREMAESGPLVFMSHRFARRHPLPRSVVTVFSCGTPHFGTDPLRGGFYDAGTVTNTSLQLAYYLGFSEVVLIGVDHSYVTSGAAAARKIPGSDRDGLPATVVSEGSDPNHFDPNYFGPGVAWGLPDWQEMEAGYRRAHHQFTATGRSIVDATVGGKLEVFPKVDFGTLFGR